MARVAAGKRRAEESRGVGGGGQQNESGVSGRTAAGGRANIAHARRGSETSMKVPATERDKKNALPKQTTD